MTPDQEKIAAWLAERSPSLHAAYGTALRLLGDPEFPGRAQLICHAGRDLCTGLQDLRGVAKKERTDTTSILREIEPEWQKEGLDALGITKDRNPELSSEQSATAQVLISGHLMTLLQQLMQEHRRGSTNQDEQAEELFKADDPDIQKRPDTLIPLRRQWVDLRHWFHHYTHFGAQQRTPEEKDLAARFVTLENCILGIIRTFYEGMEGLDAILEDANS